MATPLSFVSPSDESNTVHVDPNIGPIKRGRGRCNGMSYDTGEVDEDRYMIFRGKSLKGFAYVVQDSVVGKASLSSSDPTGLDSVRDEPEEGMEDQDEFFIEDFDAAAFVRHDIFVKTPQILRAICFISSIREKEYEQLAIWFGDANMGVDVTNSKKHATTYPDPKNTESNLPFASDD
ncbi:hypothetical protein YC2023_058016 [Brassica napus]